MVEDDTVVEDNAVELKALPVPLGDALGDGVTDGEGKALGVAEVGAVGALDAVTRVGVSVGDDVSDGVRGGVPVTLGVGDPSVPENVVEMWVETVPGAGGVGVKRVFAEPEAEPVVEEKLEDDAVMEDDAVAVVDAEDDAVDDAEWEDDAVDDAEWVDEAE